MNFTEKGLILKVGRFRESDVWVRFFSPGRGVMQAIAFGGMRSKKRFPGCLDPLNLVSLTIGSDKMGRYLSIREGVLLHAFSSIKTETLRLGPASVCLKFVEAIIQGQQDSRRVFNLLLGTLHLLETMQGGCQDIPVLFRARIAFEQGYRIALGQCACCGASREFFDKPFLFVEKGQVLCSKCATEAQSALPLSWGALRTLEFARDIPPAMWGRLCVDPSVRDEAYRAVDRFLAYHLELRLEKGSFRTI